VRSEVTTVTRPARRIRPANRRASIVTAATGLIRDRGYEHVSMGDIADVVAVSASALYRHFSSKQLLLLEVVNDALRPMTAAVDRLDLRNQEAELPALARLALDHSYLGTIWTRELRHLPVEQQQDIATRIAALAGQIAHKIGEIRPQLSFAGQDLLAWSLLGVLLSPSFQHTETARERHAVLLATMMERVLNAPVPTGYAGATAPAVDRAGLMPSTRREALLMQATKLFAQRRYASVGIEDVAASLGMAGSSIYNHFSGKSELLGVALARGAGYLYLQVAEVLSASEEPAEALRGLVRSYTNFGIAHPDLVAILITEVRNLADPYRQEALQAQRDYVNEWAQLLATSAKSQMDSGPARLQVQATLTVINTVTQVHHVRMNSEVAPAVAAIAAHLLDVTESGSRTAKSTEGRVRRTAMATTARLPDA
jgi:AcrR family transcriptional regulator